LAIGRPQLVGRLPGVRAACFGQGFGGVHSFFQTRSAANSTTAFGKRRIVSATTLSKVAGLVTVGF
jgi:hypothetical protein